MNFEFEAAKQVRDSLESKHKRLAANLKKYPKNDMGMTTDSAKATPLWKSEKMAADHAFSELQEYNKWFVRKFKNECRRKRQ